MLRDILKQQQQRAQSPAAVVPAAPAAVQPPTLAGTRIDGPGGMLLNQTTPVTPSTEPGSVAIRGVNVNSQAVPIQPPVNAASLMGRTASAGTPNGSSNVQAILRRLLAPGNAGSMLPNYSN